MYDLIDFRSHTDSQRGDLGILARLFVDLGTTNGRGGEFGRWHGVHLSNTGAFDAFQLEPLAIRRGDGADSRCR